MFIPIRSDRPLRTTPYVNYALIAVNVLIFALTTNAMADRGHWIHDLMLWKHPFPESDVVITKIWQFITYQFLHASPMHLIGNMIFLWVFGNAVEDRLGKVGYLFFYLAMGIIAGTAHWLTSGYPVLGASGSVAGVTGAFLALFPRTRITFVYFFFLIGVFEVPAMVVVLFYFAKDLLFFGIGGGNVAYTAHLAGNLCGFLVAMAMLVPRLLPREPYDLFSILAQKRRRDQFRKIADEGYQPWAGRLSKKGGVVLAPGEVPVLTEEERQILELRQAVSQAIASHELPKAAKQYAQLIDRHGEQVLSQKNQFEIANHLAGEGQHALAARAYELLLKTYPTHSDRGHVQLMLGLINARYLGKTQEAKPLLQEASQRLHGDDAALARQLLAEIG